MLSDKILLFRELLLKWHEQNHRPLPWKGERNPYFIWLSEIILQQTRVEQGMPYYLRFVERFPTVFDLANAPEDEVLKLWEGLGYYSRARNLHYAAKYIAFDLKGVFPSNYEDLLKIKGVGAYTAAAIASFAFDLPCAVVDGNVYRVLSRYFGIATPIDSNEGQKEFRSLAEKLLDASRPAVYNQAIMDFGATHCTPKLAKCKTCLLAENCSAFQNEQVDFLPVKEKKIKKKNRFFHYLIFEYQDKIWIQKREEKDIWQGLYEFPMIENEDDLDFENLFKDEFLKSKFDFQQLKIKISQPYKQQLTHQTVFALFYEISLEQFPKEIPTNWIEIARDKIEDFAFPKIIDLYRQYKKKTLTLF